ncbi:MAG: hypothetical protein AAF514_02990 [Verrucomicrobiota bacterium]
MSGDLDSSLEIIRREWRQAASSLADWAFERLVNRREVWGQYSKLSEREKLNSKKTYKALTLPQKSKRGQDMVTHEKLQRHFRSGGVQHLIGLHSTSADNTSLWLAIDIDLHDSGAVDAEDEARRNFAAAQHWWEVLQKQGYDPLLLDSNGRGGYHLLLLFDEPAPTADVYHFGQSLIADWKKRNIDAAPETFPKNAEVSGDKLGAWLRVFGLHHTHPHFTRVWSGDPWLDDPWLEGSEAIDTIMSARPGPPPPVAGDDDGKRKVSKKKAAGGFVRTKRPVVCVDLDGVLAGHDGFQGKATIGPPIPGALEFMRSLSTFATVVIFTARCSGDQRGDSEKAVVQWLEKHQIPFDRVHTGPGKPMALAFVDDRSVSCRPQSAGPLAFGMAEQAVRALCGERDPEFEGSEGAKLQNLNQRWLRIPPEVREKILNLAEDPS